MMRLMYLPTNAAWVFLFGSNVATASVLDMNGYGRFFRSRREAVDAARSSGLTVASNGTLTVTEG